MQILKDDVLRLIEKQMDNSFWNHLKYQLFGDFETCGNVDGNKIRLWKKDIVYSGNYSIFIFEFDKNNHLATISTENNPIRHKFITVIFIIFLGALLFLNGFDFRDMVHWLVTGFILLIFFLLRLILNYGTNTCKEEQLNAIYEILEIEKDEEKEREWSVGNIFIRAIMYPLCALLMAICIMLLLSEVYLQPIVVFLIVGAYLWSDITLIREISERKKK